MRALRGLLALIVLLGSLAALGVRFVPVGHVGKRGTTALQPGPAWTSPLHRIALHPATGVMHGIDDDPMRVDTSTGPVEIGVWRTDASVEAVQAGVAAGKAVPGATVLYVDRKGAARPSATRIRRATASLNEAAQAWRTAATVEARVGAEARARGQQRDVEARAVFQAQGDAEVARIEARYRDEANGIRAQVEADVAALLADGALAETTADAERDRRRAALLAGPGGRWHLAIEAARRFRLNPARLDTRHPDYFRATWGLAPWRAFFLGKAPAP